MSSFTITASIVLYKESLPDLSSAIQCFLEIPLKKKLFLIDNTPNRFFEYVFVDQCIEYIPIEENIGFGSAHNKTISRITNYSDYHLILNPDVYFDYRIIENLINQLINDKSIAMVAPKVKFPDGSHQYSCRRYPSIIELIVRRFYFHEILFRRIIYKGEYRDKDLTKPFYAEYLTGCFQLYNTSDFIKLGGFDERYFLYMEDVDICKKIENINKKKLYYPKQEITHILKQGSSKNFYLFFRHLTSAIKYFLKWGFSK